ncbi:MAG: hypothetical protein KJZ70_15845 [Bryobacterales bacterium]|nr:hypothetical protein [Bryobacterales bacterium]
MIAVAFRKAGRAAIVVLSALGFAALLSAHDLQTRVEVKPPFVVISASYEGTEAASFIAVAVHAPASAGVKADAFQTGRTDFEGKFVFLPTGPGDWRVLLDDEMGHRVELVARVAGGNRAEAAAASAPVETEGRGTGERLLVGLSVLFGAAGLLYGWLSRRPKPARG